MFDKIGLEKITIKVSNSTIIFTTVLNDQKQVLLASGRVHQNMAIGTGVWAINSNILALTLPHPTVIKLEKIKQQFNQMVS